MTILAYLNGPRIDPFLLPRLGRTESAPQLFEVYRMFILPRSSSFPAFFCPSQARATSKFLVPLIASSFLVAVPFLALDQFEDMAANPNHRQIAGPDGGSHNSNHIGKPTYITSGQFQGQTIRVELEELQKAERGRKYTRWV